jgi:membrane protein insertase Oxa1/YidC/SpoIIIJ
MEKILVLSYSIVIIILFAINLNENYNNRIYEKLKNKKTTWFWFKVFKISETKENWIKFNKGLSVFVITIMIITILFTITRK